jgi:adenine-specific DNA-methyltransferase
MNPEFKKQLNIDFQRLTESSEIFLEKLIKKEPWASKLNSAANKITSTENPVSLLSKRLSFYLLLKYLSENQVTTDGLLNQLSKQFNNSTGSSASVSGFTNDLLISYQKDKPQAKKILNDFYQSCFTNTEKRNLGQVWTPEPISELMSKWLLKNNFQPQSIQDPALGSGFLLNALLKNYTKILQNQPSVVLAGDEIDELVYLLFLFIESDNLLSYETDFRLKDGTLINKNKYQAIICNPPYTRHHHIRPADKQRMKQVIEENLDIKVNGFTSLYAYFFLNSLIQLSDKGRLAYITPSELYDSSYAKVIKQYLLKEQLIDSIIFFSKNEQVFSGVSVAGAITLLDKQKRNANINLVEINNWPGVDTILEHIDQPGDYSWGTVRQKSGQQLDNKKWLTQLNKPETDQRMIDLSQLTEKITRGIATGNNKYFVLSEEDVRKHKISKKYLKPIVRRTADVNKLLFTNTDFKHLSETKPCWLLDCKNKAFKDLPKPVQNYLNSGKAQGFNETPLVKARPLWYQVERREPADILFTYLSNGYPRFVVNQAQVLNLNTLHSITLINDFKDNKDLFNALMAILNSSVVLDNLNQVGRSYGNGTIKVEPGELKKLLTYDPRQLTAQQVKKLSSLFAENSNKDQKDFSVCRLQVDQLLEKYFKRQ